MHKPLRVLILEDDPADAELMVRELRRAGFSVEATRVEKEADFAALLSPEIDLVLADYQLPQFDGMRALSVRNARKLDVPFILVSGAIGEELAVSAMLHGAFAYVMKERLISLGPMVARAIEETEVRRESRRAHEALAAEVELRKTIEDSMLAGLLFCDLGGTIRHVNAAFCRMVGIPERQLLGASPPFAFAPAQPEDGHEERTEPWGGPREGAFETAFRRADGARIDVMILSSPLVGRDNQRLGWLRLVHDITEQKRLQAQVLQAQKMESIGVLAGGVAHDFNNILTTILVTSEFVLESLAAGDPRRTDVEDIKGAAERAAALTRQLLIFSRKEVARPVVLDLNTLIQNLEKMLRRILGEDVAMEVSLSPEPTLVRVDPGQMEQVVMNVAVNARDAMPRGGRLTLRTAVLGPDHHHAPGCTLGPSGRHVRLTAVDTGCGIPAEIIPRLFEPFFTTKPAGKGTGLGLSTVYGIVRQAGGGIEVDSEVGHGATFLIDLPYAEGAALTKSDDARAKKLGGHETILLVEDDAAVRAVGYRTLEQLGYEVITAGSGEEALEVLAAKPGRIDLLLSDVVMPGMSGVDLAKEVPRRRPGTRIALMSGYMDTGVLDELAALGHEVIHKPLSAADLARKVREILDKKEGAPAQVRP